MHSSIQQDRDEGLVRAFLDGDEGAFDALVLAYRDRVYNLCHRLMGDREDARDTAQETFVKVYRALKGFRFDSSFSTWLYAVAVNSCKNKLKSLEYRSWRRMLRTGREQEPGRGGSASGPGGP